MTFYEAVKFEGFAKSRKLLICPFSLFGKLRVKNPVVQQKSAP
jgi:hypothetical protein